jgi:hypothetical protein
VRQDGENFRLATGGPARRVLVEEFLADLRTIGASTISEMEAASVGMFKLPANIAELTELTAIARRLGLLGPRERGATETVDSNTEIEWALSEQGQELPAPRSLDVPQIVLSVARLADPARKQAVDWFPTIALLLGIGAATTTSVTSDAAANAAGAVSIALLTVVLAIHARGELGLRSAARSWPRLRKQRPATYKFHTGPRIPVVFLFVVSVIAAYGLAIFEQFRAAAIVGAAGIVLAIVQWRVWHFPAICEYREPDSWLHRRAARALLAVLPAALALMSSAVLIYALAN